MKKEYIFTFLVMVTILFTLLGTLDVFTTRPKSHFVAVGDGDAPVAYSRDGKNWTSVNQKLFGDGGQGTSITSSGPRVFVGGRDPTGSGKNISHAKIINLNKWTSVSFRPGEELGSLSGVLDSYCLGSDQDPPEVCIHATDNVPAGQSGIYYSIVGGINIKDFTISSGGSGYSVGQTGTFSGGSGKKASYRIDSVTEGAISTIKIMNIGYEYSSGDVLTFDGNGDKNATLTLNSVLTEDTTISVDGTEFESGSVKSLDYYYKILGGFPVPNWIVVGNSNGNGVAYHTPTSTPQTWKSISIPATFSDLTCIVVTGDPSKNDILVFGGTVGDGGVPIIYSFDIISPLFTRAKMTSGQTFTTSVSDITQGDVNREEGLIVSVGVAGSGTDFTNGQTGIGYSTDNGKTWTSASVPSSAEGYTFSAPAKLDNWVVSATDGTNHQTYESSDGKTWTLNSDKSLNRSASIKTRAIERQAGDAKTVISVGEFSGGGVMDNSLINNSEVVVFPLFDSVGNDAKFLRF